MCVPCKVLINQETKRAAERMDSLRELVLSFADSSVESGDLGAENDQLYEMALSEVKFIEDSRRSIRSFSKCEKVPARWAELLRRI